VQSNASRQEFKIVEIIEDEQLASISVEESQNHATPQVVKVVYLADEPEWIGVDIDRDTAVDPSLYDIMKEFLRQYFCEEFKD